LEILAHAREVLNRFITRKGEVDRPEVVAHATLSAWIHHWPASASVSDHLLIQATRQIRVAEESRWLKQRRIAIAKLARLMSSE